VKVGKHVPSTKAVKMFIFIVLGITVLEVVGYGPIALAAKYQAWRARQKAGA
jgi:hypothetical protein